VFDDFTDYLGGSSGSMQGLRTDILPQPLEALVEKAPIISVACGLGHALFLLANGKVCAWGNGGNGRLGLGDTTDRAEACLIKDLVGEVIGSVQCGASHSMAITKKNGNVYIWGKNSQGQCGKGNLEDIQRPSFNATLQSETVVKMAAGWEHTIALTSNGLLYAWGSGYKDSRRGLVPPVLGLGHAEGRSLPELVVSIKDIRIIDIASGWDHCLALDSKNRVYSWGSGQNGKERCIAFS
jgi:RCC1 and BTB domain-containing protein